MLTKDTKFTNQLPLLLHTEMSLLFHWFSQHLHPATLHPSKHWHSPKEEGTFACTHAKGGGRHDLPAQSHRAQYDALHEHEQSTQLAHSQLHETVN